MKKIFIALTLILVAASQALADGEPAHIIFGNVINLTGGNDSIYLQLNDYSVPYVIKASSITVLSYQWSSRPVMFNSIPAGQNALLNPGEPVDIIAKGNKLSILRWDGDGVYSIRLLDSNGRQILRDTLRTRKSDLEIELTPEYRYYYLEFTSSELNYDYDSVGSYVPSVDSSEHRIEFCYVMLRMKGMNAEPAEQKSEQKAESEEKNESNPATDTIEDIYRQIRKNAVNYDTVLHAEDSQDETPRQEAKQEVQETKIESKDGQEDDENERTMIPARRIKIKRNTEYESEPESESRQESE